jgi:hypothetical protein
MQRITLFALLCATLAFARDHQAPQSGTILQMDSVNCGTDQKDKHQKTHTLLCQEYVLQTDSINYHIRPKDDKHPVLLRVGEKASFQIEKNYVKLLAEDTNKEREYVVVSMTARTDAQTAQAAQATNNQK